MGEYADSLIDDGFEDFYPLPKRKKKLPDCPIYDQIKMRERLHSADLVAGVIDDDGWDTGA